MQLERTQCLFHIFRYKRTQEFGIDIVGETGAVVHRKVAARVTCAFGAADARRAVRAEERVYPPASSSSPPGSSPNGPGTSTPSASNHPNAPSPPHPNAQGHANGAHPPPSANFDSILARLRDGPSLSVYGNADAGAGSPQPNAELAARLNGFVHGGAPGPASQAQAVSPPQAHTVHRVCSELLARV
ncbi:hypothetical protein C8R43DRAFT_968815 [Mycena crocata]|nr:hypothetical protein C8R43DRAFT_968815 [Mycena crocata]